MEKAEEYQEYLSRIAGEQLNAVCFVMDYLQFQFNDCYLTVLPPLVARVGEQSYRLGDSHYRDALCERIMHSVAEVALAVDSLRIGFDDGAAFDVSLREDEFIGAEAIIFEFREAGSMQMLVIHGAA
jgi:hypothetical protein